MNSAIRYSHRFAQIVAIAAKLLPSAAIGLGASAQTAGRHPDPRYIDQTMSPSATLRLAGPRALLPITVAANASINFGRDDGAPHELFGDIASVALTSRGSIVVVDRKEQDVRLFDARGRFLQRLGRQGAGPGEFRAPHTIFVTARDEIWVADMQRRLTIFAPAPDGYRLSRTLPVDIGVRAMCSLGDALVVNGVSMDDFAVRIVDSLGKPLRSFGKIYISPNVGLNAQFAEGLIVCDSQSGLIVFASAAALGEVRAYRRDGTLVWRTVVSDVKRNIIVDNAQGGITVRGAPEGAHTLLSLHLVPGAGVIVQYGHRTPAQMQAKEPAGEIDTALLDVRSGRAILSALPWPRIAAVSRGQAVLVFEDPVPRVEVRELRRRR